LRDKVASPNHLGTQHLAATGESQAVAAAIAGLVGLGFRESEARNAVAAIAVDGDGHDVADWSAPRSAGSTPRVPRDERRARGQPEELEAERVADTALRPRSLDDFVGQDAIKNQVRILGRRHWPSAGDALDHVLALWARRGLARRRWPRSSRWRWG